MEDIEVMPMLMVWRLAAWRVEDMTAAVLGSRPGGAAAALEHVVEAQRVLVARARARAPACSGGVVYSGHAQHRQAAALVHATKLEAHAGGHHLGTEQIIVKSSLRVARS